MTKKTFFETFCSCAGPPPPAPRCAWHGHAASQRFNPEEKAKSKLPSLINLSKVVNSSELLIYNQTS